MSCICGSEDDHRELPHEHEVAALALDGDMWYAGDIVGLPEGIVGFGTTPAEACAEFDREWKAAAG